MDCGLESARGCRGDLSDFGACRFVVAQCRVTLRRHERPLEQELLAHEGKIEGRLVTSAGYDDTAGAVEDGVDLGVLPELVN